MFSKPRPSCPTGRRVREKFRRHMARLPRAETETNNGHPHQVLANDRSRVHHALAEITRSSGFEPYEVSYSRRTANLGITAGYHGHFCPRDDTWPERNDRLHTGHVVVGIDVDYYMSTQDLCHSGQPILLYSFSPSERSGTNRECSWSISDDGIVSFDVRGGGSYRHRLWDWTRSDFVSVPCHYGFVREYSVDYVRTSHTHIAVCLVPGRLYSTSWYSRFWRWLASIFSVDAPRMAAIALKRRDYAPGISVAGNSVMLQMGHSLVRIPARAHDVISVRLSRGKEVGISSIQQILAAFDVERKDALVAAAIYYSMNRVETLQTGQLQLYSRFVEDSKGNPLIEEIENARPTFVEVENPPTDLPVSAPLATRSNALAAIVERIDDVQKPFLYNNKEMLHGRMYLFAHMCCRRALVEPGSVIPLTLEELEEQTSKAATKARIKEVSDSLITATNATVEAFMKRELYTSDKKPRNISAIDSTNIALMGQYAYAMKNAVFDKLHWFMPGRGPTDISGNVHEFCCRNVGRKIKATDYSSFDGTQGPDIRELEVIMARVISGEEAAELVRREIHNVECRTAGMAYDCLGTRKSGSALTTIMNTAVNAFVQFSAGLSAGKTVDAAFDDIGLSFGDDGLTVVDVEEEANLLGMEIKMEEQCTPEKPEVDFLARVYPTPLENGGSFQDPGRVWAKFGAVENVQGVSPETMLRLKIESFGLTDSGSPVLGAYCKKYLACSSLHRKIKVCHNTRTYMMDIMGLSATNTWPQVEPTCSRTREVYARRLGVEVEDLDKAETRIANAKRLSDLRHIFVLSKESPHSARSDTIGQINGLYEPVRFMGKRTVGRTGAPVTTLTKNGSKSSTKVDSSATPSAAPATTPSQSSTSSPTASTGGASAAIHH